VLKVERCIKTMYKGRQLNAEEREERVGNFVGGSLFISSSDDLKSHHTLDLEFCAHSEFLLVVEHMDE
jgi:hypothetical protein